MLADIFMMWTHYEVFLGDRCFSLRPLTLAKKLTIMSIIASIVITVFSSTLTFNLLLHKEDKDDSSFYLINFSVSFYETGQYLFRY